MDHQAYAVIRSSQDAGVLHETYARAHNSYYKALLELTETRLKLAFHDQRLAGVIMQTARTDQVGMGTRVSWAMTQRGAFQVIDECRAIISDCKRNLKWGPPSYSRFKSHIKGCS
jgi:hypothetical protein